MRHISFEECEKMDLETARAEFSNRVYEAAILFERLENAGKVRGNGHHMAQKVAAFAEELLLERWKVKKVLSENPIHGNSYGLPYPSYSVKCPKCGRETSFLDEREYGDEVRCLHCNYVIELSEKTQNNVESDRTIPLEVGEPSTLPCSKKYCDCGNEPRAVWSEIKKQWLCEKCKRDFSGRIDIGRCMWVVSKRNCGKCEYFGDGKCRA